MINCFLVLLPVCQTLNLFIHKMLSRFSRYIIIYWFNNLEKIHITAAVAIFLSSVIHSSAHILNAHNFSKHYSSQYPELNWAVYKNQSSALLILTSVVGITGLAMLLVLVMMLLLSQKTIRNADHEVFGNSHLSFFLLFFFLYVIHPTSRVLKKQVNVASHQPGCEIPSRNIKLSFDSNFHQNNSFIPVSSTCQTKPVFHHMGQVHLYTLLPLVIFLTRFVFVKIIVRKRREFVIESIEKLPHNVIRLTLYSSNSKNISSLPGQYAILQCPSVSRLEWHPFSIISTETKYDITKMTFLIRAVGDWTNAICNNFRNSNEIMCEHLPQFSNRRMRMILDGPFFSPLENILLDGVAICVAGGIGITPFAALLNHIINEDMKKMCRPFKLHMIWVIKYTSQIQWISNILVALNEKLTCQRQLDRFTLEIYLTQETVPNLIDIPEKIDFLLEKLKFGRPVWNNLLNGWKKYYERGTLPVYICGPKPMEKQVKKVSRELQKKHGGAKLRCISETFA
ncbi:hypothetical protein LSTR_LSTR009669 [Laodelphax striatellus]|uniref:FAD-binding FR-type domain-containing protein n=1 Tax=Laodelphax striatellus TaxID=195883 RepID=A0A482WNF4_LAOST|nr:hypothetical protein LSTR_LSTR009669 [Laodelphax striatellus]